MTDNNNLQTQNNIQPHTNQIINNIPNEKNNIKYVVNLQVDGISFVSIPLNEYQSLIECNNKLREDILRLTNNEQILHSCILDRDKTINELREEKKMLLEKIELLENKYNDLKNDYTDLKNKYNKNENTKIFNKFIVAIQDLNRKEKLETKVNINTKNQLISLKNKRIGDCHYLDDSDSQTMIDDKRTILFNELTIMSVDIKLMFDKKYPNLLNDINKFIVTNRTNPTIQFIEDMKEWFYE